MTTITKCLILFLSLSVSAWATTGVMKFPTGTPVQVCQPNDTNAGCGATAGAGTVTTVSVVSTHGFSGTVANPTSTPAITISTTATGVLLGNGSSISASNVITDSGTNVGIGSVNPGQLLDVKGTIRATSLSVFGGLSTGFVKANGSIDSSSYITGNQTVTLSGDTTGSGTTAITTTLKNTGTAGTYRSTTFDAQGRETSGTNPTTFSGYAISDTSANLAAALTDETGTGAAVFASSPTLVTPALGTPASGVMTNVSGTAASLTAGNVSTIASLISQGTNVTITGGGTIASPYVINSSSSGSGTNYWNLDTGGNVGISTVYNVGIGTSQHLNLLDVSGGVSIGTTYAGYKTANTNGLVVQGSVSIGTTSNFGYLTVGATPGGSAFIDSGGTITGQSVNVDQNLTVFGATQFEDNLFVFNRTPNKIILGSNASEWFQQDSDGVAGNIGIFTTSLQRLTVLKGGNVGIGSTNPGQILDVQGTIRATGFTLTTGATNNYVLTSDASGNGTWKSGGSGSGTVTAVTLATPSSTLTLGGTNPVTTSGTINADLNLTHANTWTGQQIFNTANVGIGSATPGQALDVQGTVRATAFSGLTIPLFVIVTQSATPAINTNVTAVASITGLAQAITSMTTNLTGTPYPGQLLQIQITDNGTARGITWGTSFGATNIALPTTTVISTLLRVGFQWNATNSKWEIVALD